MDKHTPLPWESYGRLNVRSVSGEPIAACGPQRGNNPESNAINEANVTFIVRAVNSHDALVASIEDMLGSMREYHAMSRPPVKGRLGREIREAEAALKLAKGD